MTDTISTPPLRNLPTGHLEARKQHLLDEIAREPTAPRLTAHLRLPLPTHSPRWRIAAIAVAAAAAAAITVPLLVFTGKGGLGSAKPYIHPLPRVGTSERGGRQLASLVLLRAARTAAKQPAKGLSPGQFFYTKSEGWQEGQEGRPTGILPTYFQPFTRETWISPNGSTRIREVDGHLEFATRADATYFTHQLRNQPNILNAHTSDTTFKHGQYVNLNNAPTDPAQLKKLIENRTLVGGPPGDAETFLLISDLLRYSYAPPAVRSALYTIASQLPGVRLIGPTHDQLGRPGTGIAYYLPGPPSPNGAPSLDKREIYEMIFDPRTSALLAEQRVVVHRTNSTPFPPGSVTNSTAYLTSGIVDSTTATTSATP